jgi:hypothetical protein
MKRRVILFMLLTLMIATVASASHSWNNYHWARKAHPFTLKLYDNVDPAWESIVSSAVGDWNRGTIVKYNWPAGGPLSTQRKCASTTGVVEICNETYGQNGWLGIAGISLSGGHIVKGYTKLNDTYFNMQQYNTTAWRRLVACQEIAHDFGLGHQDETFNNANLGSCMDYTNDPDGGAGGFSSNDPSNISPNAHDFDQIASVYSHFDSTNSYSLMAGLQLATQAHLLPVVIDGIDDGNEPWEWGTPVGWDGDGRPNRYYQRLGNGEERITHVFWAPDVDRGGNPHDDHEH